MKLNLLKLTCSLALMGAAAAAQVQTTTTLNGPPLGIASVRDLDNLSQIQTLEAAGNDFTNRTVRCTPEYFTNNQATISADQQYRIRQEGPARGVTAAAKRFAH